MYLLLIAIILQSIIYIVFLKIGYEMGKNKEIKLSGITNVIEKVENKIEQKSNKKEEQKKQEETEKIIEAIEKFEGPY